MIPLALLRIVADATIPAQAVLALSRGLWLARHRQRGAARRMLAMAVAVLAVAYALEYLDLWMALWPRFGLDYSTHTAVALAITAVLWCFWSGGRWLWSALSAGYCALMWWLHYHSWADMLTTAAALAPWFALAAWWTCGSKATTTMA